jgi:ribokinase
MMAILVYGSLVPDIVFQVPRLPAKGEDLPAGDVRVVAAGGGGNVALALAAWGYDVRVSGNSVGTDPLGRFMADELERHGVSSPDGFVNPAGVTVPNGILVTPDGERTIIGSEYARVAWLPVGRWDGVEAVLVDAYSGRAGATVITAAAARGLPIVGTDRIGSEVSELSVLLWSGDEHADPEAARAIAASGPWVVVTGGPGPIAIHGPDGSARQITPPPHGVRDSTGAGDVFAAAVVAGLGDGLEVMDALEQAADVASRYVARPRDSGIPTLTRLEP